MHIFNVVEMIPHGSGKRRKRQGQTLLMGKKNVGGKWLRGESVAWLFFLLLRVFLLVSPGRDMQYASGYGALGSTRNGGKKFLKEVPTSSVCLTFSTEVTRTQSQSIKCRRVPSQGRVYSGRGICGEGPQPGSRREQGFLWERADTRLQGAQNSAMSKETRPREA